MLIGVPGCAFCHHTFIQVYLLCVFLPRCRLCVVCCARGSNVARVCVHIASRSISSPAASDSMKTDTPQSVPNEVSQRFEHPKCTLLFLGGFYVSFTTHFVDIQFFFVSFCDYPVRLAGRICICRESTF